jgi:hypothetical protein
VVWTSVVGVMALAGSNPVIAKCEQLRRMCVREVAGGLGASSVASFSRSCLVVGRWGSCCRCGYPVGSVYILHASTWQHL